MPLLEEMLTDTVQRKKDYLDKLFVTGVLEDAEKKNMMDYYFNPARKNEGVPFTGQEDKKDRENLLKYFVDYVHSRGAKPEDRIKAFLPVLNQKSDGAVKQVVWPAEVKRNLFLMSYHMAEGFEKDKINELILAKEAAGKPEEAKKDRELLDKGMLMLVQDPATGEFTKFISATELKAGDSAVQFLPPASPEMAAVMQPGFAVPSQQNIQSIAQGGVSPQAVASPSTYEPTASAAVPNKVSSTDELAQSFQQKRGKAIVNKLQKEGFEVQGDVQFDAAGHALVKVKSGNDNLLVSVDTRVPFDQDLKFNFTFQNGAAAGKSFTVDESKLDEAFHKPDGSIRSAGALYNDLDLSKKLGIKSDAYPEKAPAIVPPLPKVGLPGTLPAPQLPQPKEPFKVPSGTAPKPMPLEGKMEPGEQQLAGKFALPQGLKAPAMPITKEGTEGKEGVGYGIKLKVAPGIPKGSVMDAKAKLKQKEEEQGQQMAFIPPVGGPVAPGRVGTRTQTGGNKPKSNLGKVAIAANLAGISSVIGGGVMLGGNGNALPDFAMNIMKNTWIVLSHWPNLFG